MLLSAFVAIASCGSGTSESDLTTVSEPEVTETSGTLVADDTELIAAASTWINQLGLNQSDPDVWRDRLRQGAVGRYRSGR